MYGCVELCVELMENVLTDSRCFGIDSGFQVDLFNITKGLALRICRPEVLIYFDGDATVAGDPFAIYVECKASLNISSLLRRIVREGQGSHCAKDLIYSKIIKPTNSTQNPHILGT